eukprot:CAMPEP_0196575222 /NCGR_PEP_ID=MMETSP1081-20130531/4743_1 /TAXON_ID=36882 /ORGANISM="Pyramimonas amylifera, Strain CCMP720" /LENGTH=321 /DNA_ID=CAMNT_0041893451 /DNA_START=138 /DNA_END=1104 /DNA_ORIENTATION=-
MAAYFSKHIHEETYDFCPLKGPKEEYRLPKFNQQLRRAVLDSDVQEIQAAIRAGANTRMEDDFQRTVLWYCAFMGATSSVGPLCTNGGSAANVCDSEGWSPLAVAAALGHTETVRALLAHGAFANHLSPIGWNTLMFIASGKRPVWDPSEQRGRGGRVTQLGTDTPAARVECAQLLLDAGCNPFHTSQRKWSPLLLAATNGETSLVRLLLGRPDRHDNESCTVDGSTALMCASSGGHSEVCAQLLEAGWDLHIQRADGATPLFLAVQNHHTDNVRFLLERGSKAYGGYVDGLTAYTLAQEKEFHDILHVFDIHDPVPQQEN